MAHHPLRQLAEGLDNHRCNHHSRLDIPDQVVVEGHDIHQVAAGHILDIDYSLVVVAVNIGCTLREVAEDHVMEVPHDEKLAAAHLDHVMVVPLAKDQNRIHLDCHDIQYLGRHSLLVVVDRMFEREVALFEQLKYQTL